MARQQFETRLDIGTSLGNIFAISTTDALASLRTSDIVVLSDQFKGRDVPYPFNQSMKESWPALDQYAEANLRQIASGTILDIPYRVFANRNAKIRSMSLDNWITADGIDLVVDPFFLKKRPIIVLEGRIRSDLLGGDPMVKASVDDGSDIPATLTSSEGNYRLVVDATAIANREGDQSIKLEFDRSFVPNELGINADTRKLVMEAPTARKLEEGPQ